VKKHVKTAIRHGKKVAKAAAKQAKAAAIAAGKELLEQSKQEAKNMISQSIEEAKEAAVSHVRKHVCSTVGSGFFDKDAKRIKVAAHKHFDAVHKKALAHVRSGKNGAGFEDHAKRAGERFENSVEKVKNSAKSRIRAVAGCDEGSGLQLGRGGGYRVKGAGVKKGKKQGAGITRYGKNGPRKKPCTC